MTLARFSPCSRRGPKADTLLPPQSAKQHRTYCSVSHVSRGYPRHRGRDATIFNRFLTPSANAAMYRPSPPNRLHTCSGVMDGSTTAHLAVVQVTTIQLTCNHAAFEAGVRNDVEHVVRARHVQRAFHDWGDVFWKSSVHGLPPMDALYRGSPPKYRHP